VVCLDFVVDSVTTGLLKHDDLWREEDVFRVLYNVPLMGGTPTFAYP
jgi:hypothetical protein